MSADAFDVANAPGVVVASKRVISSDMATGEVLQSAGSLTLTGLAFQWVSPR